MRHSILAFAALLFTLAFLSQASAELINFSSLGSPKLAEDSESSSGIRVDLWDWSDTDGCGLCASNNGGDANDGGGDVAAWGLEAQANQYSAMTTTLSKLSDSLITSLQESGDTISINLEHGSVANGGSVGVEFFTRSGLQTKFEFAGSDDPESGSFYTVFDSAGTTTTDQAAFVDQFTLQITLIDDDGGYRMDFGNQSHLGSFAVGSSGINGIRVFNSAAATNVLSNNIAFSLAAAATPEPTTGVLFACALTSLIPRRRRQ